MRSPVVKRILENTPEHTKNYVRLCGDIIMQINQIIKQKSADNTLDTDLPQTKKWLEGNEKFTLKYLTELATELDKTIKITIE